MNYNERTDFTKGSILKKLIPFMMPILGALILQAAYGLWIFWLSADSVQPQDFRQFLREARSLTLQPLL